MKPRDTACGHRIAHRKWKETKQHPGKAGPGNMIGCLLGLISFHFLWAIHPIRPVETKGRLQRVQFYCACKVPKTIWNGSRTKRWHHGVVIGYYGSVQGGFPIYPLATEGQASKALFVWSILCALARSLPSLWPSHVLGMNIRYLWHMSWCWHHNIFSCTLTYGLGGEFLVAYEIPSRYFMIITCHCLDMSQENYPRDLPHTFASVMCMCNSRPCVYYYLPPEAVVLSVYLLMLHIHPAEVDNIWPYLLAPKHD